jgi:probable HAF family extracellular repeat protein
MILVRKTILSLAVFLIASVPLALAQGTYTQIDGPGAGYTVCSGINSAGNIAGTYNSGGTTHGFLLSGGTYITIDYPGRISTYLSGINDLNQVVGYAFNFHNFVGFMYDVQTQKFTTIRYPVRGGTTPTSINNAGIIAGYYQSGRGPHGFEFDGTTYEEILPPGKTAATMHGISASGEVVGEVVTHTSHRINFSFQQGKYLKIMIPNAPKAAVLGINSSGDALVGIYKPSMAITTGTGFLYQNNTLQALQFPGSNLTFATGVNDSGEVVGYFYDANGIHGFLWTPPADAATK